MGANPANWKNRTIFTGDNLDVMRGMNSDSVDLIYLDPPFNSNQERKAPIGSEAAGAAFKDAWTMSDVKEAEHGELAERNPALYDVITAAGSAHGKSMKAYLIMMGLRLLEMQRLLKSTGSIYLHCDPTAGHYLKALMDAVFGAQQFRGSIVWKRHSAHNLGARQWPNLHDLLLMYSNGGNWLWNTHYSEFNEDYVLKTYRHVDEKGRYKDDDLTGGRPGGDEAYQAWKGAEPASGRAWALPRHQKFPDWMGLPTEHQWQAMSIHRKLDWLDENGFIHWSSNGRPRLKRYLKDARGKITEDVWIDINPAPRRERVGYPTQKPEALLERIILASSRPDDIVLDPFCGCATACVAAENLGRQWVGIDLSPKAAELVIMRFTGRKQLTLLANRIIHRRDVPRRTDRAAPANYRTHRHTLFGQQEGRCKGCGSAFDFRHFHVDHILPKARGGDDHLENLQLLCGHCNLLKGTGTMAELKVKLRKADILR